MKVKINRQIITAVLFSAFIFTGLFATCCKALNDSERFADLYSAYLGEGKTFPSKAKAAVLTAYESLHNINDIIAFKENYINLFGLVQRVNGVRCVFEEDPELKVVKLDNGALTYVTQKENDLPEKAANVAEFKNSLAEKGIPLMYVQCPFKVQKNNPGLPCGVSDYSNENADNFIAELKKRGVDSLDLRDLFPGEQAGKNPAFFKTDHHWLPQTALLAAGELGKKLNTAYGFNMDLNLLEAEKFKTETHEDIFLGSIGRRVGRYYAGTDDFPLILPEYDTHFSCEFIKKDTPAIKRTGSFEEVWIFREHLKKDYFNVNSYAVYAGGGGSLIHCRSHKIPGKKILMLRDSFGDTLGLFLSLAAGGEITMIDLRYHTGSVKEYIEEFKPDLVLIAYCPTAFKQQYFFTFR
jgi:hypothetical protein